MIIVGCPTAVVWTRPTSASRYPSGFQQQSGFWLGLASHTKHPGCQFSTSQDKYIRSPTASSHILQSGSRLSQLIVKIIIVIYFERRSLLEGKQIRVTFFWRFDIDMPKPLIPSSVLEGMLCGVGFPKTCAGTRVCIQIRCTPALMVTLKHKHACLIECCKRFLDEW